MLRRGWVLVLLVEAAPMAQPFPLTMDEESALIWERHELLKLLRLLFHLLLGRSWLWLVLTTDLFLLLSWRRVEISRPGMLVGTILGVFREDFLLSELISLISFSLTAPGNFSFYLVDCEMFALRDTVPAAVLTLFVGIVYYTTTSCGLVIYMARIGLKLLLAMPDLPSGDFSPVVSCSCLPRWLMVFFWFEGGASTLQTSVDGISFSFWTLIDANCFS